MAKKKKVVPMFNIDEYRADTGGVLVAEGKWSANTKNHVEVIHIPKVQGKRTI